MSAITTQPVWTQEIVYKEIVKGCIYKHTCIPLDPGRRHFRLLRAVRPSLIPTFELTVFSLDDRPHYKALSYVWGTGKASRTICVNNLPFEVLPNLHKFLSLIHRTPEESSWIFIDAICINQRDWAERESQVSLMGKVYTDAFEVIAWVGVHTLPLRAEEHESYASDGPRGKRKPDPQLLAMRELLLKKGYCSRLWVVQEILLARKPTIYCGDVRIAWDELAEVVAADDSVSQRHPDHFQMLGTLSSSRASTLQDRRRSRSNGLFLSKTAWHDDARERSLSLTEVLPQFCGQECALVHDKVFGLLGMTSSLIRPDYSMSLTDLYLNVLIESLMDTWQAANMCVPQTARSQQVTVLHDSLCLALGMYQHRTALVFMSDVAFGLFGRLTDCAFFDWPQNALAQHDPCATHSRTTFAVDWARGTLAKGAGCLAAEPYRCVLQWKKMEHGDVKVPDEYGIPERIPLRDLIKRIEEIYLDVLERKFNGRTLYAELMDAIPQLLRFDLDRVDRIVDDIVRFPTPREAISLMSQAKKVLRRALDRKASKDATRRESPSRRALLEAHYRLSSELHARSTQYIAPGPGYLREFLVKNVRVLGMISDVLGKGHFLPHPS